MNDHDKEISKILNLITAYQKSQVLFTFHELKIAQILENGKRKTTRQIARLLDIDVVGTEKFLNAAVTLGLLEKEKNKFSNSELTENFLVQNRRFFLGGQIERYQMRSSRVWSKLTKRLQDRQSNGDQKSEPEADDQGAQALEEQFRLALLHGTELGRHFDFSTYRKLLDLGGGTGAMAIGICHRNPKLEAVVFDLPENMSVAEKYIKRENLENRISFVGGDFKEDALPEDFDAVLLANFMAVADAKENRQLLKKLYKNLPVGGAIIISGWMLDDSQLAPLISVLFCLEDICWNAPDVERSEKVYTRWLEKAGFVNISSTMYLDPTKMLIGYKVASV